MEGSRSERILCKALLGVPNTALVFLAAACANDGGGARRPIRQT